MKIVSWNVNGIRAVLKKDALLPFIEAFQPDILCLQETKASKDQVEIDLPQYEEYWYSADKKGYSGTAIFTKTKPKSVLYGLPEAFKNTYLLTDKYGDSLIEGRVLTLEFEAFYINTVYTPNAKDDLARIPLRQQWDPAYLAFIRSLEKKKPVIFCGDFNVAHTEDDLARPKENEGKKGFTQEERRGFDAIIKAGFIDSFRNFHSGNGYYTWWSHWGAARARNVGWRIDYILISPQLKKALKSASIYPQVIGSDHCPIAIELNIKVTDSIKDISG
jgi:exodeoxyribonuclease-3